MDEKEKKPLYWEPDPDIGFNVSRREDGGMHITFEDVAPETLAQWREFALTHLIDSDRLTRNLYDLRKIDQIPSEAIQVALEVNSDPSARNIRVAVIVSSDSVAEAVKEIAAMSTFASARIRIFSDLAEGQAWLDRPLNTLV